MLRFLKCFLNDTRLIKHLAVGIFLVAFAHSRYSQGSFLARLSLFTDDYSEDFRNLAQKQGDPVLIYLYQQSADFIDYMKPQDDLMRENGCWKFVDWIARDGQTYAQPMMDSTWTRGLPESSSDKLYILSFLPDSEAPVSPPLAHIGIAYHGQFWNWNRDNVYIEKLGMLINEDYAGKMVALRFVCTIRH